ncbi:glycosyl transferase family 2 [Kribbella flavida DSM 17836]|uniref:Glycosyl transferase family 2 n=1 Tax=Kribbella flavida (strain DSM 17836 / JCM 10339 / NBRC 14399) TaxID=479435 RepID=D2PYJ3_KRIFD|nr:glycosyltransferase [Kribbella flavida]ADB29839.1 glycosyl transferase family 2 [Kribbella flavida DSM 17836]
MSTTVAIAVITFRRPELLRVLLRSLQAQELPADSDYAVRIVVVDNDAAGSATEVIAEAAEAGPYPVDSAIEPEPGIPFAREKSVQLAWDDDALIFVDDDEVAPPGWLATLLGAWQTTGADVVTGPVQGILPPGAPAWNRYSDVHDSTGKHGTGDVLNKAYTNNTLVAQKVYHQVTPAFHPAFRFTGSSDLHFFLRVHQAGFRIVWCEEARITEDVPASRTTLRWLVRRAFRSGSGDSISRVLIRPGAVSVATALAYALARIGSAFAFGLAGLVLVRKTYLLKAVRRFFSGIGSLAGIVGINHDEYRERHHTDGGDAVRRDLAAGEGAGPAQLADPGDPPVADHPDARLP